MFSSLQRVVRGVRVVPKLSVRCPVLTAVSHLRTVPSTNLSKTQLQVSETSDLPEGQTIVRVDSELRDETVSKATAAAAQGVNRRRSNVVKEVLMQISIMMIMIPMMMIMVIMMIMIMIPMMI